MASASTTVTTVAIATPPALIASPAPCLNFRSGRAAISRAAIAAIATTMARVAAG